MNTARKFLSTSGLLEIVHTVFEKIKVQIKGNRKEPITITDCLMSAVAIFGLKYSSLLQFDRDYCSKEPIKHNLRTLYKVNQAPSDTYMRERLDEVDPQDVRKSFKAIFAQIQRGKLLETFKFIDDYYLVSIDGTSFFSSNKISCANCCEKKHTNGDTTYYHQMLCGVVVHPDIKTVIPFAPEPIMKSDGMNKNDCEQNAMKRFVQDFRREYPHLKTIVTTDSLSSKGPTINLFKAANMRYILGAKPGDHKFLFEFVNGICHTIKDHVTPDGRIQTFRYINNVPLNDSNTNVMVNFLELTEINPKAKGKKSTTYSWVTDIHISKNSIHLIAKGGRARWKIENETFNTLKNQGYEFEHNFGHGNKNLSTIFGMLMLLAFLIDQVQESCDSLFQGALLKEERKKYLWERMRSIFFLINLTSWQELWNAIIHDFKAMFIINTT